MFFPKGVKMLADAKSGRRFRIKLSESESGWMESGQITMLPSGTQRPAALMGTVRTQKNEDNTSVSVSISQQVPYKIETGDNEINAAFYYCSVYTNWIVYDSSDPVIDSIIWSQKDSQTCGLSIKLAPGKSVWGYNAFYSGQKFAIDLMYPPKISGQWPKPLSGLNVILDPGHSMKYSPPYDGAIGPRGTLEPEVNLAIAKELEAKFSELGATVTLTRRGTEEIPLTERPNIAWKAGGNIFLSIHNNGIADGEDPFAIPRGFSVYYYHPYSKELAGRIHKSYVKNISLPDEGLRFGDYRVLRITQMPGVLVESAYLMFPQQEEMLLSREFHKKLAGTLLEGVLDLFRMKQPKIPPVIQVPFSGKPEITKPQKNPAARKPVQSKTKNSEKNDKRKTPKKSPVSGRKTG